MFYVVLTFIDWINHIIFIKKVENTKKTWDVFYFIVFIMYDYVNNKIPFVQNLYRWLFPKIKKKQKNTRYLRFRVIGKNNV